VNAVQLGGTTGDFNSTMKTSLENGIWDSTASSHNTSLTLGNKLNSAASAGDPLSSAVPGSYGAGTAGYIIGNGMKVSVGTGTGQINVASGKVPATLVNSDITGNVSADIKAITAGVDFNAAMKTSLNAATPATITGLTFRSGVAVNGFPFFMALSSDRHSPATGKTITAMRSIDGGTFVACTNSATETSDGFYKINLSAADMNGHMITLKFTALGCEPTSKTIITSQ
jgi:hypothetical protein